ncbi:MAG: rhodanese-like domain-containing protein [Thermodesulfobacteriota bacterium]
MTPRYSSAITLCLICAVLLCAPSAWAAKARPVYKGKVLGHSIKARSISLATDQGAVLIRYDGKSQGVEHAIKGHGAIIFYTMRGKLPFATEIKPKLVKLPPGVSDISLAELRVLVDNRVNFSLIDSRHQMYYAQGHLPGAISIPMCEMDELTGLLPVNKEKLLVFYCNGPTCAQSPKNAGLAVKAGYTNVRVFLAGAPGWQRMGLPLYASYGMVCKGNIVLIDLRDEEKAAARRIPRAISMPLAQLEEKMEAIPLKAPVVLYSDDPRQTLAAYGIFHASGFKQVSLVKGGFQGWTKEGGATEKGPLLQGVNWQRQVGRDEISLAAFKKSINKPKPQELILDVRNREEVKELGRLPHAVNIPLAEICSRLDELDRAKTIYAYCSSGARAEMAARELRKHHFNAFALRAEVRCEKGSCTVVE